MSVNTTTVLVVEFQHLRWSFAINVVSTAMAQRAQSYDLLRQLSGQVLQVFLENGFEEHSESTQSFLAFLLSNKLPDGTQIDQWLGHEIVPEHLKRQVLFGFAQWINLRIRSLDALVPLQTNALTVCHARLQNHIATPQTLQVPVTSVRAQSVMRDFIYQVVLQLLGSEFSCFASALAVLSESSDLAEHPAMLLSHLVKQLEHCRAKVVQVAFELTPEQRTDRTDRTGSSLGLVMSMIMQFCRYFTVEFKSEANHVWHHLLEHETCGDIFQQSPFRINLIDSYGSLLVMLLHVEGLHKADLLVAVDFEGVKLNRSGQLCLVQITLSDMPSCVYMLDVYVLPLAMHFATPSGTSLKAILEDPALLKIWFDPRNDVDALYYQFGIVPQHVFDLQLADVAVRRAKGLQVNFVPSLQKCLTSCDRLGRMQKTFADFINKTGKQLFEPDHGGRYEVFQQRPLLPDLLVYAAHDCRYMQLLYQWYCENLSDEWKQRVLAGSRSRAQWFAHPKYQRPSTDAPDF